MTDDQKAFLIEYEELCLRYRMFVGACGCCNSPWLTEGEMYSKGFDANFEKHMEHMRDEEES